MTRTLLRVTGDLNIRALCAFALVFGLASSSEAAVVITASSGQVALGGTVDITYSISGADAGKAASYTADVDFNATNLTVNSACDAGGACNSNSNCPAGASCNVASCFLNSVLTPGYTATFTLTAVGKLTTNISAKASPPTLFLNADTAHQGLMFTCTFGAAQTAPSATYPLTTSFIEVGDQDGNVLDSNSPNTSITIGGGTPLPTSTPTNTVTGPTSTPTNTPVNTATNTPTNTPANTATQTPTATNTPTPTITITKTPTNTATPTATPTATNTPTPIPTFTAPVGAASQGATSLTISGTVPAGFPAFGQITQIGGTPVPTPIGYTLNGNTLTLASGLPNAVSAGTVVTVVAVTPPTATPTATNTAKPTATFTVPPATATPIPATDDNGCQITTAGGGGSAWLLLIPAFGLMVARRKRR